MTPNTNREYYRALLAECRRRGYRATRMHRKYPKSELWKTRRRLYRRLERALSRLLAEEAPFLDDALNPVWTEGHFKRFRHSTRFKRYNREFKDGRVRWRRKEDDRGGRTGSTTSMETCNPSHSEGHQGRMSS